MGILDFKAFGADQFFVSIAEPEDYHEVLKVWDSFTIEWQWLSFDKADLNLHRNELSARLAASFKSSLSTWFLLSCEGETVGYLSLEKMLGSKCAHRANLHMAIKQEFWGTGSADILIENCLKHAKKLGVRRLELGVFESNYRAIRFYERHGFTVEGRKVGAVRDNACFQDGFAMSKILPGVS